MDTEEETHVVTSDTLNAFALTSIGRLHASVKLRGVLVDVITQIALKNYTKGCDYVT